MFKPERFLNEDGTFRDDPTLSLAFGAGKRICPGRYLVEATLFVVAASVLSVFNVTKARDENGHEIPVSPAMQSDAISRCFFCLSCCASLNVLLDFYSQPAKFECSITPRDKVSEDLIRMNVLA